MKQSKVCTQIGETLVQSLSLTLLTTDVYSLVKLKSTFGIWVLIEMQSVLRNQQENSMSAL